MFSNYKKFLVGLFVFLSFSVIFVKFYENKSHYILFLANKEYKVDIARSPKELERGLSGRESLTQDSGLLFVFDKPDNYGFWMNDMNFPIDIIWISDENKIIHIEKSISPSTFPNVYYPNGKALYVLEVSAGESELLKLKIGDEVKFSKKSF